MATVDFNSAIYYTISDGKICRQHREPVEGSVSRVNKNGKTVHETFYKGLKGRIVGIETKDGDYGKFWNVTLEDESGTKEILQFQYSSGYANGFLRALPNVDLSSEVVVSPNMKMEGDKKKTTIFLSQHGNAIKWFYTKDAPNGMPELKQIKVKGKVTWDDSEILDFLEKMVRNEILPQLNAKKYEVVGEAFTVENEEEDAPF